MAYAPRAVRAALALALALGLVAFSVELAHHSVHHLGHEEDARACVLAKAATHAPVELAHPPEMAPARAPARFAAPWPRGVAPVVSLSGRASPRAPPLPA